MRNDEILVFKIPVGESRMTKGAVISLYVATHYRMAGLDIVDPRAFVTPINCCLLIQKSNKVFNRSRNDITS
jgi:hypothetical protein